MSPPTQTSGGGHEQRCPVCGKLANVDPSIPPGDGTCPFCGSLLWFDSHEGPADSHEGPDWLRAIDAFRACIEHIPDNVMYRQLLRNSECKHLGSPARSGGRHARHRLNKLRVQLQAARAEHDWDRVDRAAENVLAIDPWNVDANEALGEAAEKRGFVDVAKFAWLSALKSAPDREDLKEKLAELG